MKTFLQPTPMMASINVVPIIDVALVLVIILLITAPMLVAADIEILLPAAVTRAEDEVRVSITVGKSGEIAIENDRVGPDQLDAALRARLSEVGDADVLVVVRADEGTSHETVRQILRGARNAGARRLAIATRQHAGGRS